MSGIEGKQGGPALANLSVKTAQRQHLFGNVISEDDDVVLQSRAQLKGAAIHRDDLEEPRIAQSLYRR